MPSVMLSMVLSMVPSMLLKMARGGAVGCVGLALVSSMGCDVDARQPVVEGAGGRWELLAPLEHGPRQETAILSLRDEIVVVGGFNELAAVVNDVDAFDPAAGTWRRLAKLPETLHHANGAVVDDTLVVAGFLVGAEFRPEGRVFIYDPDDDAWTVGAPMPAGTGRGASGVTAHNGFVYVFGGTLSGSSAFASRYHVESDAWEELADVPAALDHLAAATIGDTIFVVGGRTNGLRNVRADLLAFDPATQEWSERTAMPTARGGFAASVINGRLLVVGGEGNALDDRGVFPQVEAYDPATDEWRALVEMRTPRHGMGAATVDGAVYVPGGADVQGLGAVDVFERFVPVE